MDPLCGEGLRQRGLAATCRVRAFGLVAWSMTSPKGECKYVAYAWALMGFLSAPLGASVCTITILDLSEYKTKQSSILQLYWGIWDHSFGDMLGIRDHNIGNN